MTALPPIGVLEPLVAEGVALRIAARTLVGPIDLEVAAGECHVLIGPNGAGKTTLLRLLAGLRTPTAGLVRIGATRYTALARRELAQRIAYVPQSRPESVPLTVRELVLQGRFPHHAPWRWSPTREDFAAVETALATAEVQALAERPLDELSGGERQLAFIAAALAQEAPLLLLDEPTSFLDPRHQREVALLLRRLRREGARTVIVATHDLAFAAAVATRVTALDRGQRVGEGSPGEMLSPARLEALFAAPFRAMEGVDVTPVPMLEIGP